MTREHYLRDDIPCGLLDCPTCSVHSPATQLAPSHQLSPISYRPCLSSSAEEVVIINLSCALHQLDLLEHPAFKNAVLLQSVMEEVKSQSLPAFNRLKALIEAPGKHFYSFSNEHHHKTYCPRRPAESPAQRIDRALLSAARWYAEHLAPLGIRVALIASPQEPALEQPEAEAPGPAAECVLPETIEQYVVRSLAISQPEIMDLLVRSGDDDGSSSSSSSSSDANTLPLHFPLAPQPCPAYQPSSDLLLGIKSGRYLQGSFHADQEDWNEGYVTTYGQVPLRILIRGAAHVNRALEGDVVAIKLISNPKLNAATLESNVAAPESLSFGQVIGIIRRQSKPYCGAVLWQPEYDALPPGEHVLVCGCVDSRIPPVCLRTSHPLSLKDQRIVFAIDAWHPCDLYPRGHIVRKLGSLSDRETETQSLLTQFQIRTAAFPPAVMACLPDSGWQIPAAERARREDLRHLRICSIDPPGCTDIDDALHALLLPNGNYEVGVHIADVTHFVTHDSPIDLEARLRSVTVYLVDRRIQMLPEVLGTNLCSLRSDVERLAFSCIWELTPSAEIVSVRFTRSIILSKASFTYAQAKARIDDAQATDPLSKDLRVLLNLSRILRQRREAQGALMLASPEIKFKHREETSKKPSSSASSSEEKEEKEGEEEEEEESEEGPSTDPVDIEMYKQSETNYLVEEFMLLANISVATKILRHYPSFALLRRHPKPEQALLADLNKQLAHTGIQLDLTSSKTLATSLDAAQRKDPFFNTLLRILVTRQMNQAIYFSAGTIPPSDFTHYGLAQNIYTHFTSPIRRYADVIVHRLLAAAIDIAPLPHNINKDSVQRICHSINRHHRAAQHASIASAALYTHIFFKGKEVFEDAYVIKIRPDRIGVLIRSYGFEGTILFDRSNPLSAQYSFDPEAQCFVVGDKRITLFDVIPVKLTVTSKPPLGEQLAIIPLLESSSTSSSSTSSSSTSSSTSSSSTSSSSTSSSSTSSSTSSSLSDDPIESSKKQLSPSQPPPPSKRTRRQ